ncbi:MAG: hypothetical protein PHV48_05235 [Candidatus Omnitrophica bacterium]|nr:hypothetical protein [Candidatus Omnitrophota bacterium]
MRLFKYIMILGMVTLTALVYVHQQVELVKLSYEIDCKEKKLKEILDRKGVLRYNISNLESPSRLERVLLERKVSVFYPKKGQIIRLARKPSYTPNPSLRVSGLGERAGIFKLFDFLSGRPEINAREK